MKYKIIDLLFRALIKHRGQIFIFTNECFAFVWNNKHCPEFKSVFDIEAKDFNHEDVLLVLLFREWMRCL